MTAPMTKTLLEELDANPDARRLVLQALEEAARICDERSASQAEMAEGEMEMYRKARAWDAKVLGAAIRAFAATLTPGQEPTSTSVGNAPCPASGSPNAQERPDCVLV